MQTAIWTVIGAAALVGIRAAIKSYRAHKSGKDIAVDAIEAIVDKIDGHDK